MIIRRHRRFTVNLGDFESYSFGADVELSHHDLGVTDGALQRMPPEGHAALRAKLTEAVLGELDEQLLEEVQEASELTAHKRSFLRRVISDASTNAKPKAKPRKANTNA